MKHFKGVLSILLLITIFSFIACSDSPGSDLDNSSNSDNSSEAGNNDGNNTTSAYIGTKAPTEAKAVGDIVFKDGSAMPYTDFIALDETAKNPKRFSAIALIFYKGAGLNSGNDVTTSRTLGVGIKHNKNGLAWCTESADAYNINITSIQCPESTKLVFTGDKNGSNNLAQIEEFEGVDDTDNTNAATNYPAFYFGKNYKDVYGSNVKGTDFETGWYLPSIAELAQIFACRTDSVNGFDIDAVSLALGSDRFGTSIYWSSTQDKSEKKWACIFNFNYSDVEVAGKASTTNLYACCIRDFN